MLAFFKRSQVLDSGQAAARLHRITDDECQILFAYWTARGRARLALGKLSAVILSGVFLAAIPAIAGALGSQPVIDISDWLTTFIAILAAGYAAMGLVLYGPLASMSNQDAERFKKALPAAVVEAADCIDDDALFLLLINHPSHLRNATHI